MKQACAGLMICGTLGAVLAVSCGKTEDSRARTGGDAAPRSVRTARAELRPMERLLAVTGTLAAQERSTLSTKVAGRLQRLAVDVGSVVRQGDLLAQVEPRDYELRVQQAAAALAQARAALGLPLEGSDDQVNLETISAVKQAKAVLEEAQKNRERVSSLNQAGIVPPAEFDTAEAAYKVALARYDTALEDVRSRLATLAERRAEHEIARKQLADASIRAPFDGAIQARPASPGEYVAAGTPIVTLVKTDPLRLRLEVPERASGLVATGQLVRLTVEGNTNVFAGRITRLSPALDDLNRMLLVEADVPNPGALRPGLFARAQIIVDEGDEGLCVPLNTLVTFAGIEKVIAIAEGRAVERTVATGRRGEDWVEILSGLKVGEAVVIEPGGLRTGQAVVATEQTSGPRHHAPDTADARLGHGE